MKAYKLDRKTWAIMELVHNPRLAGRFPRITALAYSLGFRDVYRFAEDDEKVPTLQGYLQEFI